ncbi:MAG: hypothetical protein A2675_03645 [Candidatus Yonathbacteria bacterium RIFCSPHIGHO2_01_FULL_51_10]|uniref:M23ase beta-sheet core domain-containing protein n=1 Tax=Candidatus Yonathbacteria bacterium RIFCSPHIGHO2_01_FULL_51_10 TaxID=1802723 RepID=A0A1G2S8T9_9BACT|nr:MAG: hypothetical protein A2675_03645 [Candidatus Yonathbacteria bacterium RIFCSPHIGHO2_01_FULL_51_10]
MVACFRSRYLKILVGTICATALSGVFPFPVVSADTITDLNQKIQSKATDIDQLKAEISTYQKQVEQTGKEAQTLKGVVNTLTVTQKKLETDLKLTQNKLDATTYGIQKTSIEIGDAESHIGQSTQDIAAMIRTVDALDQSSLVEVMFSDESLADFLGRLTAIEQLQQALHDHIVDLTATRTDLQDKKTQQQVQQKSLATLQSELGDRKAIVASSKTEKNQLLTQTKNKEANYQKILAAKIALKDAFEKELTDYEAQLHSIINPSLLPAKGSAPLLWPLASILITQYFGDTDFARSGAYSGKGHNGMDFNAPIGTQIFAGADGTIEGTGDTDLACPRASFGKWVFIRHNNGLASTYAHLSLIKVVQGQQVKAGDLIGYSGNTGYSTGPHLHLSVYASQAVSVQSRPSKVCNATYTMPIGALNGYLDPMDYLPALP